MKLFLRFFASILLATAIPGAYSQSGRPISLQVILTPPCTPFLGEYASQAGSRLQVRLVVNDSRMINYPVRLLMYLERINSGVVMRTSEYTGIAPILVSWGVGEIISGPGLSPYFMGQNNVFTGFDQSYFIQTGRIPEGQYRIGFKAVDAQRTDVELSNLVFSPPGWFLLNDPPQLNLPLDKTSEKVKDFQQVHFEWYPRHLGSMNAGFAANYQLELYPIRVPGMDARQVVMSGQAAYMVSTNQTRFRLGEHHYPLEPGVEYAWRVRARGPEGMGLFQNQGYSEVFSFVYGSLCPVPGGTGATVLGTDKADIWWETDPMARAYEVQIHKQGSGQSPWHPYTTTGNLQRVENILEPGTTYEYRVKATCLQGESPFSPIKNFSTMQFEPPADFNCGKDDNLPEITNFKPKISLKPGDIIYNGKFPVKITEIEGGMGNFSGKGRMRIPMLANIQVNMQFTDIKVNELNQLYAGEMVSIYDPDSKYYIDDMGSYLREGDQAGNILSGIDSAAITLDYPVGNGNLTVTITGNTVTIHGPGGTTVVTVVDAENGTTIADANGNLFVVDGQGNVRLTGHSTGNTNNADYAAKTKTWDQLSKEYTVEFEGHGKWAFDERKEAYAGSLFDQEYQNLEGYYVPWKLIPLGKSDKIKARLTKGNIENPEKLRFFTPAGTEYLAQYNDGNYYLELLGARKNDGIELYALYMPDDSTQIPAGKMRVASYPRISRSLVLVPMDEELHEIIISQEELNQIYGSYNIDWQVKTDQPFTSSGITNLQATGSSFWSEYTEEMKALNAAYIEERGIDNESLYLFVFKGGDAQGSLLGDMPLESRFGYIFRAKEAESGKLNHTTAHELGHGAFQLKHTFSSKYNIAGQTTDNLMDYPKQGTSGGTELVKYQWDAIHDPQNRLFGWMQGEEEGMMSVPCFGIFDDCDVVMSLVEKLKKYAAQNKKVEAKAGKESKALFAYAKYLHIGGTDYNQIRVILNPVVGKNILFDPGEIIDYKKSFLRKNGSTDRQFGIVYMHEGKEYLRILIEEEKDLAGKRESLKKYILGARYNQNTTVKDSTLSDYEEIVENVFGGIKVNEQSKLVVKKEKCIKQTDDCTCQCTSKKYTGTNPTSWNYVFNKVVYKPVSEKISLKSDPIEFEFEVIAKNISGFQKTLINTKEIITFETARLKEAIFKINENLENDHPTIIGVTYGAKKGPYNAPGNTTDHYMVIVSKGRDTKGVYFRFFDPAISNGSQNNLKLYINPENLIISGDCFDYRIGDEYYLVELLLDEKLPICGIAPKVDPLILKMREAYGKNKDYNFDEETQSID